MNAKQRMMQRLIAIRKRIEAESADGVYSSFDTYDKGAIDDGVQYDPHEDTRPDFVKEDEAGWEIIARLDGPGSSI